jgi:hypothetical protein
MNTCRWMVVATLAGMTSLTLARDAAAQDMTLKGGIAVSRLESSEPTYWDDRLTTTFFGVHARFRFGPIGLQPELMVVTKGASASEALEQEQIRLEYIEIPVLLVVPLSIGQFQPFVYAGPALMLESRCRWFFREQGLRRNLGCDPPRDEVFRRKVLRLRRHRRRRCGIPTGPRPGQRRGTSQLGHAQRAPGSGSGAAQPHILRDTRLLPELGADQLTSSGRRAPG